MRKCLCLNIFFNEVYNMGRGKKIKKPVTVDIKQLKGCLSRPKKPVSLDEMEAAIKNRKRMS